MRNNANDDLKDETLTGCVRVMEQSPDIDSVFLNAGVQQPYNLVDTENFNIAKFHEEVKVNFSSFVSLCNAFLPYLQKKTEPTSFIMWVFFP